MTMAIHTTTLRCGETLHVLVDATADGLRRLVEAKMRTLLKPNGHGVVDATGRLTFIVDEEIHPAQWHDDGNRVRGNRVRREVAADGTVTTTVLRQVWMSGV